MQFSRNRELSASRVGGLIFLFNFSEANRLFPYDSDTMSLPRQYFLAHLRNAFIDGLFLMRVYKMLCSIDIYFRCQTKICD